MKVDASSVVTLTAMLVTLAPAEAFAPSTTGTAIRRSRGKWPNTSLPPGEKLPMVSVVTLRFWS